jgi:hypothetical protein
MNRDKADSIMPSLEMLAVFRGIFKRVAVELDIDPSYVSRVARGERNAPFVSEALRREIQRALGKAGLHNGHNGDGKNHDHSNATVAAVLNGHSTDGHLRDGHTSSNHTSVDGRPKTKTKSKSQPKKQSAPAARRRKPSSPGNRRAVSSKGHASPSAR